MDTIIKSISFNIPVEKDVIEISYFLDEGFDRKYVVKLLKALESMNFGKFELGKKGRGHSTKFYPSKNCPKSFTIEVVQKKRGRKKTK